MLIPNYYRIQISIQLSESRDSIRIPLSAFKQGSKNEFENLVPAKRYIEKLFNHDEPMLWIQFMNPDCDIYGVVLDDTMTILIEPVTVTDTIQSMEALNDNQPERVGAGFAIFRELFPNSWDGTNIGFYNDGTGFIEDEEGEVITNFKTFEGLIQKLLETRTWVKF